MKKGAEKVDTSGPDSRLLDEMKDDTAAKRDDGENELQTKRNGEGTGTNRSPGGKLSGLKEKVKAKLHKN